MIEHFFERKEPYNTILEMTPELAKEFLDHCNTHNRKQRIAHVERIADDMRCGRWKLTHQGIAFDRNGVLLDGQHRLLAVIRSGVTVPMRVFFNESPESLMGIDAGRPRTHDELITLDGRLGPVTSKELATLRTMVNGLNMRYKGMTATREAGLLGRYRPAITFAHEVLRSSEFPGVVNSVVRGVIARAYYSAPTDKLRRFASVLQSGIMTEESEQPIILLLRYLSRTAGRVYAAEPRRETYAKTERALSAYLRGERLTRLCAASDELFTIPDAGDDESP